MPDGIRYLKRAEIDAEKWDASIQHSTNGKIYAYSSFLDAMASHWDALVSGEYQAVMPLPWRKKFGFHYLYQPLFVAQLGVITSRPDPLQVRKFLESIPSKFRLREIPLNHENLFAIEGYGLYERMNYVLNLDKDYESIQSHYRDQTRRNLRKSITAGCRSQSNIALDEVVRLAQSHGKEVKKEDWQRFVSLFRQYQFKGQAVTYGIYAAEGKLLSSAGFLFSNGRAYYLLVGNHPDGRESGASHALIDAFIRDHAGQNVLLDFEGSDVPGVAFFYSSFGAVEERYAAMKDNRLPPILKKFK
jgi:hypothetical protein